MPKGRGRTQTHKEPHESFGGFYIPVKLINEIKATQSGTSTQSAHVARLLELGLKALKRKGGGLSETD